LRSSDNITSKIKKFEIKVKWNHKKLHNKHKNKLLGTEFSHLNDKKEERERKNKFFQFCRLSWKIIHMGALECPIFVLIFSSLVFFAPSFIYLPTRYECGLYSFKMSLNLFSCHFLLCLFYIFFLFLLLFNVVFNLVMFLWSFCVCFL